MNEHNIFLLRADQYQQDPSDWFVMPEVDITCLDSGSHPIRLIGSRGSGKTMILRSLAGQPLGESTIDKSKLAQNRLRIYIRPDNQLMGGMTGWGLEQPVWRAASIELILLRIFEEAAIKINNWLEKNEMPHLRINSHQFCFDEKGEDLSNWIRIRQHHLYVWARCPNDKPPIVLATLSSLSSLLKSLEIHINDFPKNIAVSVYIDEQETYLKYQQIIINDWIKNPPVGWVFHVAHRRYLKYVIETSTDEIIDQSNDFRILDLDEPLVSSSKGSSKVREKFYTRILFNEVKELDGFDIKLEDFSPNKLLLKELNIAQNLRDDKSAQEAWRRLTETSAKFSGVESQVAISEGNKIDDAKWWAAWPIIVARGRIDDRDIFRDRNFLHNHLNGAFLQIYFESKGKAPMHFYSGFSALCSIVLSNVREFILIIKQAIELERQNDESNTMLSLLKQGISATSQYKAVMSRSKHFNNVVAISAAERGYAIEQALNNWFLFFSVTQLLPNLPYNEPNHISCSTSIDETNKAWITIEAGEKHGAFIYSPPSKQRENTKNNQIDIRIHPLLVAKHYLSYAKRNTPLLDFDTISLITKATSNDEIRTIAQKGMKPLSSRYQKTLF